MRRILDAFLECLLILIRRRTIVLPWFQELLSLSQTMLRERRKPSNNTPSLFAPVGHLIPVIMRTKKMRKIYSVCHLWSTYLLTTASTLRRKPAAKPIVEATARQQDSRDEAILAASLGSEDCYICNDCGNSPCDWFTRYGPAVREYHQLQLDLYGPEEFMPPHNIQRHRLYRQMALHLGFIRRDKHALCVLEGICQIVPSPNGA
jgi:hypothetical protein